MVAGSVASIVYGEPRLTNNVDIVLVLDDSQIRQLPSLFPADRFFCPPSEVIAAESRRSPRGHFNIIHHDTGLKADLYPAGAEPLQAWGLASSESKCPGNASRKSDCPSKFRMPVATARHKSVRSAANSFKRLSRPSTAATISSKSWLAR